MLIVAHGHILRSIIWYFNGFPQAGEETDFEIETCEIYRFVKEF